MSIENDDKEPRTEIARRVFEYWKYTCKHPRANIDTKRMEVICAMLKANYTEDDLRLAIYGCSVNPWNQGQNPSKTIYDSVQLIFRNGDQVDRLMRIGAERKFALKRQKEIAAEEDAERLKASIPGDAYKSVKGTLLKLVKRNDE